MGQLTKSDEELDGIILQRSERTDRPKSESSPNSFLVVTTEVLDIDVLEGQPDALQDSLKNYKQHLLQKLDDSSGSNNVGSGTKQPPRREVLIKALDFGDPNSA